MIHPDSRSREWLQRVAGENDFPNIPLIEKAVRAFSLPKSHAKFFYQVAYATNTDTEYILLDVLFEEIHYNQIDKLPIASRFLKTESESVFVNTPCVADLLGDKCNPKQVFS